MRIMIGTPCGGGVVSTQYMLSFLTSHDAMNQHKHEIYRQLIQQFPGGFQEGNQQHINAMTQAMNQHTMDIGIYTLTGESLLARGRNHIAAQMLYGGWDKLFFIDADTGWTWEDFKQIAMSPHPIIGGVVPLKMYPHAPRTFETSLNYLPFMEDESL